ncbi:hypothetical protein Tco_0729089 [Tanacetum coccineum]|uniref:Reverse transcriptase domain-containing protein n=1 Tax=Tanacetum coccineum TaxID=301880 RepID=A0ABQ4YRE9_9ASTR
MESMESILRMLRSNPPISLIDTQESDDQTEVTYDKEQCLSHNYTAHVTPLAYIPSIPFLATIEPAGTLLMGDEVISTIPARETNEFIKSSVDDLVPIPMESEVTSDRVFKCDMPDTTPCIVVLGDEEIDLLLRDDLDTLLSGDREIDFDPIRDIEELECLLVNDPIPNPMMFDVPLDDSIPTEIDDGYYDSDGDILYFEQLLIKYSSSNVSPALLPTESSLLVTPLPDPKHICLREVERFDPFIFLTQSGKKTRVIETPSFGFHHMPSPRPAAYLPKEVMYRYYHPHLTSGDGFDHGLKTK